MNPADPAALVPFRGLRFRPDLPGGLADVIGPPADIESSDEARAFVRDKPHSAIRLELADAGDELRFSEARELLGRWRRDGVLRSDGALCYYIYEQEFEEGGRRRARRGVFGLVPLDVPEVVVLPHEETWADNLERRAQLLRDLDASLSPIFLLYDGENSGITSLLDELTWRAPDASGVDETGERHRLWVVSHFEHVQRMYQAMRGRHYMIADGHHRFAAAQIVHDEQPRPETAVVLACCVETSDPGIVIRPIHRTVVREPRRPWDDVLETLQHWFDVEEEPVAGRAGDDLARALPEGGFPAIGIVRAATDTLLTLRLRDWEAALPFLPSDMVDAARRLDVTVASELVIHHALDLDPSDFTHDLGFTNDANEAVEAVQAGSADMAILLRPVRLEQVLAVARAGGKVPPKSTSFVPKVPMGLVMHDFEGVADE